MANLILQSLHDTRYEVFEYLLNNIGLIYHSDAQLDILNSECNSVFHFICYNRLHDLAKFVQVRDYKPPFNDFLNRLSYITIFEYACYCNFIDTVRAMIDKIPYDDYLYAFHLACYGRSLSVIKYFIEERSLGNDSYSYPKCEKETTGLDIAIQMNYDEIVEYLMPIRLNMVV